MNKLIKFSALLVPAAAPVALLAATAEPTSLAVLSGECFVAAFVSLFIVLGLNADYGRALRPLELPRTSPLPPRRRNAYTFRRGADVARLNAPVAPSPVCRRAIAATAALA